MKGSHKKKRQSVRKDGSEQHSCPSFAERTVVAKPTKKDARSQANKKTV